MHETPPSSQRQDESAPSGLVKETISQREAPPAAFQMLYDENSDTHYDASIHNTDYGQAEVSSFDPEQMLQSIAKTFNIDMTSPDGMRHLQQVLESLSHSAVRLQINQDEFGNTSVHRETP